MDNFFQKLRDIQKKERTTGTLSEIDDSFYSDASNYLQELLKMVNNNPLSLEAYQLRDAQRITTEICERREFKIVSTAATNVQKSHDLFKGHRKDSELYDVIPYNTTPEEEEFYRKIVDMMVGHREKLMDKIVLNKASNETKIGFKPVRKEEKSPEPTYEVSVPEEDSSEEMLSHEENSSQDKEKQKPFSKEPMLDESQIAMMFGQAPDDILLDENNNPVKAVKRDITTPFKGPKAPKEDTVTLQNSPDEVKKVSETQKEAESDTKIHEETVPDKGDVPQESEDSSAAEPVQESIAFDNEELVEFIRDIDTDILDENEKTYGPFLVDDIVLLPRSIVEILNSNGVINIIK